MLEAKVRTLGLGDQVEFLGAVTHPVALKEMAAATVVVNPSWTEGLPTTVLEGAAMGACVIATDVGGTAEIVTDGETGWLVPAQQPRVLAKALKEALTDEAHRNVMAELLAKNTAEKFSWDNAVEVVTAMMRGTPIPGQH
jgi:glycosyltransferase involved in cell wall biosynthesis